MLVRLQELNEILSNPYGYAKNYKKEFNKKAVGYLCSYTPEELIFAADALPFRLFQTGESINRADTYLQTYCCHFVRGILEEGLSGNLDFLDAAVFPHTCDSMQRLSDIWRLHVPLQFHFDVVLPLKLNTESAREYMVDIFMKFKIDLEKNLQIEISEHNIRYAITIYNQIREGIKTIHAIRHENPAIIKGNEFYTIMKTSMMIDRNILPSILTDIIFELEKKKEVDSFTNRKKLVLAGSMCDLPDIYNIIEDVGGVVVWDNFCTGSRYFEGLINKDGDPIVSIAERYLKRIVCPAKYGGITSRAENLIDIVKNNNADGVVFILLKFCDPHAFDYPYLKKLLDKEGIPHALIEMEDQFSLGERLKTRFEAFIETL
ncbi:MAG TPA: 2-hydroxyacyl-CoA dehydratase family protein [Syntrophales bacterium]|nr:2-hydroxyacyl-CoA dehydratase family protein [Syntrophales bacterium]